MNKRCIILTLIVSGMTFLTGCHGTMNRKVSEIAPNLESRQEIQIVPMQYRYPAQQGVSYLPSEQFILCRRKKTCPEKKDFTSLPPSARVSAVAPPAVPQPPQPRSIILTPEIPLRSTVYFPSGSVELEPKALNILDQIISRLQGIDLSSIRMVIAGYTDSTGSLEINTRLAQARAEAVANYFRENRIIPKEIVTGCRPLCCYVTPNDTAEGRTENRRAEIWIEPIAEETEDEKPE